MTEADDANTGAETAQLLRVEEPWPPGEAGLALQLRVWRLAPGRLAVMFADYTTADDRLTPMIRRVMAEYPDDSITFYYEEVSNQLSPGYYAVLAPADDAELTETVLNGPGISALHNALGPTLRQTSRPEDDRPLWGGP
ncbi:hypothetical protein ABT040_33810 [Streptomyces sp. NPDC002688]|uniref:hypothetical protein n=1 Tax=Streptomyces sp. NPDC002688 TaxID=3154423 RepID=UPI003324182E